jgi:GNAT superfamily N-acetyltransferase
MTPMIEIVPLTRELFADLAALFEEGGDPKWCWCTFFRNRNAYWNTTTAEKNRAELLSRADDDPAAGLVAYEDGRAVGWVSLGPRDDYERLTSSKILAPIDDTPVWSIVCFVVARSRRGSGIATALLQAAIDYAAAHGATMLEAYPVEPGEARLSAAKAYRGTIGMFEKAGFEVVVRRQANASSAPRPIVRRAVSNRS